jgi:predicted Fe-Mo cluster-binding NifX family protein
MKLAIPIHENRVMPRFGYTQKMMIITIEDAQVTEAEQVSITPETFWSSLTAEEVSVIICGGIHPRFQQSIRELGIQLVWGVVGEWEDVLQAYLNGTLHTNPTFCLHRGQTRRLRRGHQRR